MAKFELSLTQIATLAELWSEGAVITSEAQRLLSLHTASNDRLVKWLLSFKAPPKLVMSGDAREWSEFCKQLCALANANSPPAEVRETPHEVVVASPTHEAIAVASSNPNRSYHWERVGHSTNDMWMKVDVEPTHYADIYVYAALDALSLLGVWRHEEKKVLCFMQSDGALPN